MASLVRSDRPWRYVSLRRLSAGFESGRIRLTFGRESRSEPVSYGRPETGPPEAADRQRYPAPHAMGPILSANRLIRRKKPDYGAFGAKSSDNYATWSGKRSLTSHLRRKIIVSKFREAMVSQVSGRFPVAEDRRHLQGQSATIERSNGKRGLIAFNFIRSVGGPGSRRREENQRPPRLTGGHK